MNAPADTLPSLPDSRPARRRRCKCGKWTPPKDTYVTIHWSAEVAVPRDAQVQIVFFCPKCGRRHEGGALIDSAMKPIGIS